MNLSYEYMRRIRREEQDKLLDLRRERVVKTLRSLDLHGGSHAMLSQIAYAIHPHVGAWDEGACDHLRNVLAELIGGDHEAASGAQRHSHCGTGGCHSRNESKEVGDGMAGGGRGMRDACGVGALGCMDYSDVHQADVGYPFAQYDVLGNERHKAVCELRKLGKCSPLAHNFRDALAAAVAVPKDGAPYDDGELCHLICDRLIHLLGGDQSHDTSPMRQENETGITDELREYVRTHETTTMVYATMPLQKEEKPTPNGDKLLAIADEIDEQFARCCELWERTTIDTAQEIHDSMEAECNKLQAECDRLTAALDELHADPANDAICRLERERDELCAERADLLNLLRDARDEYKMLDRMSAETSANFHAMRDRVWGLEAERDELQARLDELSTQNDMLRDKLDELSTSGATELYKLLKRTVGDAKQIADKLNAHNGMLKESERLRSENAKCAADAINKACMYLDLLRDAARDYKALQDRLNHMVEVCQIYTEANA